jgi:ComF family protein
LVDDVLDIVFPRFCCGCDERISERNLVVCRNCTEALEPVPLPYCPICGAGNARFVGADRCDDCPAGVIAFEAVRACFSFAGTAERVTKKLKYDHREEFADYMAGHMANWLPVLYKVVPFDVIVPVPLHPARQRERGFNQAELIAHRIGKGLGIPVSASLIARFRQTPTQTRLSRAERASNVAGAFRTGKPAAIAGKAVLLVDDVCTTGATLNECAKVLREAGSGPVRGLTFARAAVGFADRP